MDVYSRRIVGWAMADHMRTELIVDAFEMAIATRRPAPGLVHHSDHGSQYTSFTFGKTLRNAGVAASMGRVKTCYDMFFTTPPMSTGSGCTNDYRSTGIPFGGHA